MEVRGLGKTGNGDIPKLEIRSMSKEFGYIWGEHESASCRRWLQQAVWDPCMVPASSTEPEHGCPGLDSFGSSYVCLPHNHS